MDADFSSAIRANVVLVGAELAALSSDTLQLLLRGGIGIADLHAHLVVADCHSMVLLDDFLALITALEAVKRVSNQPVSDRARVCIPYRAKPTPRLLPMLSRRILLERT